MTTLVVSGMALAGALAWYFYWKPHARKFEQSGYTPPASSWFAEFAFGFLTWLVTFVSVGRVKVIGRERSPKSGRAIFVSNHQYPCDFAMLRRGAGRHFRMLTDSGQLKGFFGVISAALGVISVGFKNKNDGALAEQACLRSVASKHFRIGSGLAALIWAVAAGILISSCFGAFSSWLVPALAALAAVIVASLPGSDSALGIFPQGGLLPDDPELKENFRPGAVRIGQGAGELANEPVHIVPMALYYRLDPARADWTHKVLGRFRSIFLATRNPKYWNPVFRKSTEGLPAAEVEAIEAERKAIMKAHLKARATIYGGVVVVGDPIDVKDLPSDPIEAASFIRGKVAELLSEAKKH